MDFTWTDDSAIYQAQHGEAGSPRTVSAWDYIRGRMDGYTPEELNAFAGGKNC